ncbi:unnamed protein product, partial [Polarella glacialis]
ICFCQLVSNEAKTALLAQYVCSAFQSDLAGCNKAVVVQVNRIFEGKGPMACRSEEVELLVADQFSRSAVPICVPAQCPNIDVEAVLLRGWQKTGFRLALLANSSARGRIPYSNINNINKINNINNNDNNDNAGQSKEDAQSWLKLLITRENLAAPPQQPQQQQQQQQQEQQRRRYTWTPRSPPALVPVVGVCVEGPSYRLQGAVLKNMASSLLGLEVSFAVVAALGARSSEDCESGINVFRTAFGKRL